MENEIRILAGCDSCGRRLVDRVGNLLADVMLFNRGDGYRPLCPPCLDDALVEITQIE